MLAVAEDYVLPWPDYHQLKAHNTLKAGLLHRIAVPEGLRIDIAMDFIFGLSHAKRCDGIYVVLDRLNKYASFIPCSSSAIAEGVAQFLVNHARKLHRFNGSVITKRHPKHVGAFCCACMTRLGIYHNAPTANYLEVDDKTECTKPGLAQYLLLYT